MIVAGTHVALAFRWESRSYHPHRGAIPHPPDAAALRLEDVSFTDANGTVLRGWYIPSRTGAAVVLCHGTDADRSRLLPEARAVARGGMGALLFDWPGHGESGGDVRFGGPEQVALERAVDFLSARPDVDPHRIGALGTSMGAFLLFHAASRDPRLRAIVLEGGFANIGEQIRAEFAPLGYTRSLGALLAGLAHGIDSPTEDPGVVLRAISPRPLLVVAGTADVTVPLALSRRVYDLADAPKQFWAIPRAAHGQYVAADSTYGRRLLEFFERSLSR